MGHVTEENFKDFEKAYKKAVKEEKQLFKFEGNTILVSFARYLIEYVKSEKI